MEGVGILNKLLVSINNLISDEKEQKLRSKLGKEIRSFIFTDNIVNKLNGNGYSGFVEGTEETMVLFSMIFPVFVEIDGITFRLYKDKIEFDLTNQMKDRYIYIFLDGRLTSGLFQCFRLYDKEYIYGLKKIINVIVNFKETIKEELVNLDKKENLYKEKMIHYKDSQIIAENNFNELITYLNNLK